MKDLKERLIWELAGVFSSTAEARMIVSDAGFDDRLIDFQGSALRVWQNIVQQVIAEGRVSDLIDTVRDIYVLKPLVEDIQAALAADPDVFGHLRDLGELKGELTSRLADMFIDQSHARTAATHASMSLGNVDFDGRPIVTWTSIVEEAIRQRRLKNLIRAAERIAGVEDDPLFKDVCAILDRDAQAFEKI